MRNLQLATAKGSRFFPLDLNYIRLVLRKTLVSSDDVRIRWMMGLASIAWALTLWTQPHFLDRRFFEIMRAMMPAWGWGLCFFAHGAGAMWRIFERRERIAWGLVVNGWGVAVWVAATVAQDIVGGWDVPSSTLEVFGCLFLLGSMVTTGSASKSTTA